MESVAGWECVVYVWVMCSRGRGGRIMAALSERWGQHSWWYDWPGPAAGGRTHQHPEGPPPHPLYHSFPPSLLLLISLVFPPLALFPPSHLSLAHTFFSHYSCLPLFLHPRLYKLPRRLLGRDEEGRSEGVMGRDQVQQVNEWEDVLGEGNEIHKVWV